MSPCTPRPAGWLRSRGLLLLALFLSGCASSPGSVPDAAREVEAAVADFYETLGRLDFREMADRVTPTFEIVDGGRRMDLRGLESFILGIVDQGVTFDFLLADLNTRISGEIAYTTLRSRNRPMEADFFETLILRRVEGRWLVDRFHSTPVR